MQSSSLKSLPIPVAALLAVLLPTMLTTQPARAQERHNAPWSTVSASETSSPGAPQPAASTATLTPAQAQQTLDVLQNADKRDQLIQTLRVIAQVAPQLPAQALPQVSPSAPPSPPPQGQVSNQTQDQTPAADNLGVQLLAQASAWLDDLSSQLAAGARTVSDFPAVWHWLVKTAEDPEAHSALIDVAWKLALVLACALAVEWVLQRAIRRPLAAVARYVPALARPRVRPPATERVEPARSKSGREWLRRSTGLADVGWIILRFPFVLCD